MDYSRAARTYAKQKASECEAHSQIQKELYDHYGVKKDCVTETAEACSRV